MADFEHVDGFIRCPYFLLNKNLQFVPILKMILPPNQRFLKIVMSGSKSQAKVIPIAIQPRSVNSVQLPSSDQIIKFFSSFYGGCGIMFMVGRFPSPSCSSSHFVFFCLLTSCDWKERGTSSFKEIIVQWCTLSNPKS